jgi:hypothetical protein
VDMPTIGPECQRLATDQKGLAATDRENSLYL